MKDRKSFVVGFLSGMAPPTPFERIDLPRLSGTDASRMRGDVERVGKQFSAVIDRKSQDARNPQSSRGGPGRSARSPASWDPVSAVFDEKIL